MSSQIKTVASLIDVDTIKRHLFPPDNEMESFDSWDWPDAHSQKSNCKEQCWLQECLLSLSSTGELLVIAHKNVMIILTSKWDSQEEGEVKTKYHITWRGNPCEHENEQITSVLCLPLISQGKSSHCGPDWTCIIAGFSSGFVRFYTENSSLLLSELLHNESVTHLKCQSFEPARFPTAQEHSEEVYVMYPTAVCVLTGFGLFQTLRACRNQLARVQANCGGVLKAPPLTYKKWGFAEQNRVADSEVVGPATNNTFDHLVTASLCGGFSASYRSSAPQTSLILAAGKKPYVGFHYALEGESSPIFADVTKAVVNRVRSAFGQVVPGWMRGKGNSSVEKVKEISTIEPPVSMVCRFGLCDILRHGDRVVISPNRNLSIVSDSLGRVVLIDNLKGLAIRMWKGYRDAQCGWLEVREEGRQHGINSKNVRQPQVALFLVIYVPKQGIIEIWAMQQGPRVAKFTASKSGRLLYIGYGLVGLNNIPLKGGNRPQFSCVFIDPSGLVKEISVPFHVALSDKNSKRARDLHLLKKLKAFLKEGDYDDEKLVEEVRQTVQELKTNDIRTQAIEMLSTSKYIIPDALSTAVNIVVDKLIEQAPESLDHSCKALLQMAQQLQRLVSFYQFVHQEHEIPPTYNTVVADDLNSPQTLSSLLQAPEREVLGLRKLVETIDSVALKTNSQLETRVTFREDGKTAFVEFLSCFEVGGPLQESSTISLKKNVPEDKRKRSGEIMYQGTLYSNTKVEDWKRAAAESRIDPAHLMQLALQFWLQKREGVALEAEMLRFAELLKAICSLADVNVICAEYNELSSWWRDIRNLLIDSTNPFMALTAAIVCRAVALHVEKEKESKNNSHDVSMPNTVPADEVSQRQELSTVLPDDETHSSANEWENVSRDTCQWSLLIGQLEDVALLDTVLRQNPAPAEKGGVTISSKHQLFCCPYNRPAVSLSYILNKGRGSVSELVARWLSCAGLDPRRLVDLSDVEFDNVEQQHAEENAFRKAASLDIKEGCKLEVEQGAEVTPTNEHESGILANLSILKCHFPYSLTSSILLANLCWEFMLIWHRNVDELDALCAAVKCLQTVPSPHLKEGLCSMVWTMHIKQRFESAAQLFQKVGKTPKERLCRQDIGISDLEMPLFLEKCTDFLDIFLEASLMNAAPVLLDASRYEELWNCGESGPPSLAELALTQSTVNYDLLHLHYQLALALHMLASFNLRFTRPITSLFDSVGQAALFADLTSQPQLPSHNPDPLCVSVRTHFLCRVITGAIQMIHKVESDENDQDDQVKTLDARFAVQWMSKCHSLACVWQVSSDALRRHQICELYSSGYDRLAEEVMPAVQNPSLLASQLLVIMGQRLQKVVMNSADKGATMSYLCPALSTWLDSLDEDNLKSSGTPELINLPQLLAHIMQHLPENHDEYNLAVYMVDTVQALAVWTLKMKALTEQVYVDDIEAEEEGIADALMDNDTMAQVARPGTSLRTPNTEKGGPNQGLSFRPRTQTGRPVSGVVRPATQSGRPGTMEQALRTPRTARTARPITSQSARSVRLGTASMLTESGGPFIQLSRLNLGKYAAQGNIAKPLFEYIFYHENDIRHAMELAVQATQACQFKDWWWKVQLGKCYFTLGLIRDAEQQFRSALKQNQKVEMFLRLARVYIRLDQPLSALDVCKTGLEYFPGEVTLVTEIARLFEGLNNIPTSIKYYRDVLKEDSTHVEAIACIGMQYFYTDQPEISLRFYRRLLQMGIYNAELFNNLGLCCFYAQQYDMTLTCFEQALSLATDEAVADVWYNIAHVAIGVGDCNLAMQCLRLCLSADSNHASAYNNLGVLEMRLGHPEQARAFFQAAGSLAPYLFEPHHNYAKLAEEMGDLQTSYIVIQKALQAYPSHVGSQELLQKLQKHFAFM